MKIKNHKIKGNKIEIIIPKILFDRNKYPNCSDNRFKNKYFKIKLYDNDPNKLMYFIIMCASFIKNNNYNDYINSKHYNINLKYQNKIYYTVMASLIYNFNSYSNAVFYKKLLNSKKNYTAHDNIIINNINIYHEPSYYKNNYTKNFNSKNDQFINGLNLFDKSIQYKVNQLNYDYYIILSVIVDTSNYKNVLSSITNYAHIVSNKVNYVHKNYNIIYGFYAENYFVKMLYLSYILCNHVFKDHYNLKNTFSIIEIIHKDKVINSTQHFQYNIKYNSLSFPNELKFLCKYISYKNRFKIIKIIYVLSKLSINRRDQFLYDNYITNKIISMI